jgi:hypothetical protein
MIYVFWTPNSGSCFCEFEEEIIELWKIQKVMRIGAEKFMKKKGLKIFVSKKSWAWVFWD